MISKLETLPNEILLDIFCYLSWNKMLISLWSLNERINFLICLIFSKDKHGIIFNQTDLSYKIFSEILLPLICKSSLLSSVVKYIHFDGINTNSYNLISQSFFSNNDNKTFYFPNLKSLKVTQCLLSQSLIKTLSLLIHYQLDQLTLSLDERMIKFIRDPDDPSIIAHNKKKLITMFKQLIRQFFFPDKCQLICLRLDIADDDLPMNIHQCLILPSHSSTSSISNKFQYSCLTLRYLYIRIKYSCFLEHLIEHIPNIERLSVIFKRSINIESRSKSNMIISRKSNGNWFEKVPKLNYFTLKTILDNDIELDYLKWILNNLNHIEKLKVHLHFNRMDSFEDTMVKVHVVDASFIRQYCLPDIVTNIKSFHFYIVSQCQLLSNNIEKIINSFKIDQFFISRQLTNVTCYTDRIMSYQYISSSSIANIPPSVNGLIFSPNVFTWPNIQHVSINLHPSVYLLFERFDEMFPNSSHIKVYTG
ncbi:unnamed protein product [Rotaria magnacalcarata]|uniref:F-box domain-containing protein n=3 Tax=Rotaria magnacalcarata TaxID=392030 RepID=A0A815YE59_9BILA|nr:unnamed protein product [Rotaria magnacalcarata]CAF1655088.1 unnamed protein product [Rotaria magnacalcarata]CAF4074738.1 unnamed protein product [Rotaria magnacalcarata]